MCEVCGSTIGHKNGCPEADYSPEIIGYCCTCDEPIYSDQEHFDIDGAKHHYDCFCDEYLKTP